MFIRHLRFSSKVLPFTKSLSSFHKHTFYQDWLKFPENDVMIAMAIAAPVGGLCVGLSMLYLSPDARIWKSERKDPLRGEDEMTNPKNG